MRGRPMRYAGRSAALVLWLVVFALAGAHTANSQRSARASACEAIVQRARSAAPNRRNYSYVYLLREQGGETLIRATMHVRDPQTIDGEMTFEPGPGFRIRRRGL